MIAQLPPPGAPAIPTWSRAAIHDTVAAIVHQRPYWRNPRMSPLERLLQWLGDQLDRLFQTVSTVPYGRRIATVAACVLGLLVLARLAYAARLRSERVEPGRSRRTGRMPTPDAWREAETLAAAGRYTEAAHALYRAALALLAARGLVRLHESKTSGDYARELRRRGVPAYAAFRRFGTRYDRIIYGTGQCDAADYAVLLADAQPLADDPSEARAA
jgi:hypothetical protein